MNQVRIEERRHIHAADPVQDGLSPFSNIFSRVHGANARLGVPSSRLPQARPSSQSVTLITLAVFSQCRPSSVCSMVWLIMRPSSSNSNRKRPVNSSFRPVPATMLVIFSTTSLTCPVLDLPHVSHLTINFSFRRCAGVDGLQPFLTMRSDRILSLTFPTTGTLPQATGAVHRAAV
jgi:hypothetical protein